MGPPSPDFPVVAGVDVGGPAKGFHAVALRGAEIVGKIHSLQAREVAAWCVGHAATVVAVDAPCRWRGEGRPARLAERSLARDGISCFSTPTEAAANGHAFYTWMFAGMKMFRSLAPSHPLWIGESGSTKLTIETFPQAVACALAGKVVSAKEKNSVRRALLVRRGIDVARLSNIDEVDAALCAVAAQAFTAGAYQTYGDAEGGFIITPPWSGRAGAPGTGCEVGPKSTARPSQALAGIIAALPSLTAGEREILLHHLSASERLVS
jgi:predicted nuclease with RNAse H fold